MVVGVSLRAEQITEHSTEVSDIWLGLELERTAVSQVLGKLRGATLAKRGNGDGLLLFHNQLVLFGGRFCLESLPGKASLQKVNEHVSDGLQIVSARLFHAQMIVDGSVTRSTGERTSLSLRDVLKSPRVAVTLG